MKFRDWLAFLGLSVAWGSSFFWIKIAIQEVGPITLVALRLTLGVVGLLAAVAFLRPAWPKTRQVWLALAVMGFTNTAVPFLLVTWGELHIDSGVASILVSSVPLFTTLIAHAFLEDDRLTRTRGLGLIVGFIGVVLLVSRDLGEANGGGGLRLLGQGAVLLSAIAYAFSGVYARHQFKGVSPVIQSLVPLIVADAVMWIALPLFELPLVLPRSPLAWAAVLWLGVVGSFLAFLVYFYLIHSAGPTRTSMFAYTFPLTGVILGVGFLGEALDLWLLLGGGLVVASILIVNWRREPRL